MAKTVKVLGNDLGCLTVFVIFFLSPRQVTKKYYFLPHIYSPLMSIIYDSGCWRRH